MTNKLKCFAVYVLTGGDASECCDLLCSLSVNLKDFFPHVLDLKVIMALCIEDLYKRSCVDGWCMYYCFLKIMF